MRRKLIAAAAAGAALAALAGARGSFGALARGLLPRNEAAGWALSNLVRPGMTEPEVVAILGWPNETDYLGSPDYHIKVCTYWFYRVTVAYDRHGRVRPGGVDRPALWP